MSYQNKWTMGFQAHNNFLGGPNHPLCFENLSISSPAGLGWGLHIKLNTTVHSYSPFIFQVLKNLREKGPKASEKWTGEDEAFLIPPVFLNQYQVAVNSLKQL